MSWIPNLRSRDAATKARIDADALATARAEIGRLELQRDNARARCDAAEEENGRLKADISKLIEGREANLKQLAAASQRIEALDSLVADERKIARAYRESLDQTSDQLASQNTLIRAVRAALSTYDDLARQEAKKYMAVVKAMTNTPPET